MIQLTQSESVLFALRALYEKHGYSQYKMNKFEEYDLYAKNKDFLISDSVITFTDGNGKLLALKPDVTLSIVKNTADTTDNIKKLYYNENVYRIAKGQRNFKEIMQVGLECIGNVDCYSVYEVIKTAAESLDEISEPNVLSVSHIGILSEVMDYVGIPEAEKSSVLHLIGEKNLHELSTKLEEAGIPAEKTELLIKLIKLGGNTKDVIAAIKKDYKSIVSKKTIDEFADVMSALADEKSVILDFSTVGDINYYNGFVFKGFVEGIPESVLSGGQYDTLMKKMGHKSKAVGFAVYLDLTEGLKKKRNEYDVDVFLLYDAKTKLSDISDKVKALNDDGRSVLTGSALPEKIKYKELIKL